MPATGAEPTNGVPIDRRETLVFHLLVAAAALFPILTVALPPLADLPNHLARFHVMNNLASDTNLQLHYRVTWQIFSFQSTDLIVPPLAKLVGLEAAARLAFIATFGTLFGGTLCLHKALFGRVGLWPAVAALLFYNFMLAWGLLSFLFTAGLALMLLAGWIATLRREGVARSLIFTLGTLIIFLFHPFAFAVFALLLAVFELSRWLREKPLDWRNFIRRAILGGCLLIPGALILLTPHSPVPAFNLYGSLDDKVRAVLSPIAMYLDWPDFALGFALVFFFWLGRRLDLFVFAKSIRWPVVALAVAAVLVPSHLMSVWGSDFRLPTLVLLLLIGGADLVFKNRRQALAFAGIVVVLVSARSAFIARDWRQMAADAAEFRAADTVLAPGSKVVVMQSALENRAQPAAILFPYRHVASYAVIDRDVFLPHLFIGTTPLRFAEGYKDWIETDQLAVFRKPEWHPTAPAFAAADAETVRQVEQTQQAIQLFDLETSTVDWSDWPERFDYLIDFGYGRWENPVPALLTELHRGSYFTIYRIHPPQP